MQTLGRKTQGEQLSTPIPSGVVLGLGLKEASDV